MQQMSRIPSVGSAAGAIIIPPPKNGVFAIADQRLVDLDRGLVVELDRQRHRA